MESKPTKFRILRGFVRRRVVLRAVVLVFTASVLLWMQFISRSGPSLVNPRDCAGSGISNRFLKPIFDEFQLIECEANVNLTVSVVENLMGAQLLSYGGKSLCVGEGSSSSVLALRELGFSDASEVYKQSLFSLKHRNLVYELDYEENSFDFVFVKELDMVSVPARLIVQIERILKPGGIGAMLGSNSNGLIRSATPVSLFLKNSNVVHVAYVNNFTLVAFRKKTDNAGYFGQFRLPGYCPSFMTNKPFIPLMEPLVKEKPPGFEEGIAYLPSFVDVSSKTRPVYIDIGAGEHIGSTAKSWFLPNYPINPGSFNVYLVDHNTSVLLLHVNKPGVTFVYHPGLAGTDVGVTNITEDDDLAFGDDGFDFLGWFKETVSFADFVVLRMTAGDVQLKFLSDLFDSGAICFVDELFLNCSVMEEKGNVGEECLNLFKDLRSSGAFVHQWWGE